MSADRFKGVNNWGDSTLTDRLKTNFKYFLDWAFVDIGAYFNVNIPQSGAYGGDESRLIPIRDRRRSRSSATATRVWEGFRGNWVWESGVEQPTQPIQVSGVYVDGVFQALGDGHYVDYINGRVIFDTAVPTTSTVTAEYSFKIVNVLDANDIPWFRNTQFESFRIDTNKDYNYASGERANLGEVKVELPAVAVEVGGGDYRPFQIGGGQYAYTDIVLHVIGENGSDVDKIADILADQSLKTFYLFNPDQVSESGAWPLNYQGAIASGAKTYPDMIKPSEEGGYRWRTIRITDAEREKQNKINDNLYIRPVRLTTEVVLTTI